ncbi:MAG: glycosyltransferase [bacterium]|nr:glycosyltransferase [bacterium]
MAVSKKVLIFSLAYYPHVGGAEVALKEITDRITDVEFHMLTRRVRGEAREERIGNVHVHRVSGGPSYLSKVLFVPRAALAAYALHRLHRFDAFWAMMSYMLFPVVLLRLAGVRVPYLLTLQEGDPFEHVFNRVHILPFRPLIRSGFKHAGAVQAISTFLARWAMQAGFRGHVDVVPNGVDIQKFEGTSVAHEGIVLVTTGRLVHKNAVDDVIRALVRLPSNIRFVIYGIGPDEPTLQALSKTLRVESRVHFAGHISHDALPGALRASDIFIRPSRSEGMGNSFIEAMAAGLPVIATQEGGIADFLFDAKRNQDKEATGWAVDKDSPEQIAQAVQHILAHPDEVRQTVANAEKLVSEKYDWNLIAQKMRALLDRVTSMRVVIATPLYPPEVGGPATYVRELEEGLPARGVEVELVKFGDVRRLPKLLRHWAYYRLVLRAARKADLVLALDPVSVGLPAMYAARKLGKPFVVKIVGDYAWEQGQQRFGVTEPLDDFVKTRQQSFFVRMLQRIQTRVALRATRIIVPSEYLKRIVVAWGIPSEKVEVVYNGIELAPVAQSPTTHPPGFLVVSVGRRVPWKGFEALERVVAREKGWHIFIASGLPRAEALGWVKAADAFVLNSRYEGLSHALLEAMMLGTPIIATNVGGNTELIENGRTGLLVPSGDDEALFNALKQVEHDALTARTRAAAARERVQSFSISGMLDATATALKRLV